MKVAKLSDRQLIDEAICQLQPKIGSYQQALTDELIERFENSLKTDEWAEVVL